MSCHVSCVKCHMSHVMCHISHVTCHMSCVTCHNFNLILIYLFFGQSCEAYHSGKYLLVMVKGVPCVVARETAPSQTSDMGKKTVLVLAYSFLLL